MPLSIIYSFRQLFYDKKSAGIIPLSFSWVQKETFHLKYSHCKFQNFSLHLTLSHEFWPSEKKSQGCFEHLSFSLLFNKDEIFISSTFKSGTHLYNREVQLQMCYSKEVKCPQMCHVIKIDLVWLRCPIHPFYVGMFLTEYLVLWEHPYLLYDLN